MKRKSLLAILVLLIAVLTFSACAKTDSHTLNNYTENAMIQHFENKDFIAGVLAQEYKEAMGLGDELSFAVTVSHKTEDRHAFIYSFKTETAAQSFYDSLHDSTKNLSGNFVITNLNFPQINDYFD